MNDLISRQAAIEEIRNLKISVAGKDIFPNESKETIIKTLDELPSVQTKQRTGHWIDTGNYFMGAYGNINYVECSCCHEDSLEEGDYCPNCGAKIEGYAASANSNDDLYTKAIENCYEKWNRRTENAD